MLSRQGQMCGLYNASHTIWVIKCELYDLNHTIYESNIRRLLINFSLSRVKIKFLRATSTDNKPWDGLEILKFNNIRAKRVHFDQDRLLKPFFKAILGVRRTLYANAFQMKLFTQFHAVLEFGPWIFARKTSSGLVLYHEAFVIFFFQFQSHNAIEKSLKTASVQLTSESDYDQTLTKVLLPNFGYQWP